MKEILIVVDMQNDFINGSLGTPEAEAIIANVVAKIGKYPRENVIATRDTHGANYLDTKEGAFLPVVHCVKGTEGWEIHPAVAAALGDVQKIDKPTFGSQELVDVLVEKNKEEAIAVEMIGLCTDICVVTNALLLKTALPETDVIVDASCCAGVTPESHQAALTTMTMCQVSVK